MKNVEAPVSAEMLSWGTLSMSVDSPPSPSHRAQCSINPDV